MGVSHLHFLGTASAGACLARMADFTQGRSARSGCLERYKTAAQCLNTHNLHVHTHTHTHTCTHTHTHTHTHVHVGLLQSFFFLSCGAHGNVKHTHADIFLHSQPGMGLGAEPDHKPEGSGWHVLQPGFLQGLLRSSVWCSRV